MVDSALKGLFGGGDDRGDARQGSGGNPLEGLFGGGDGDDNEPRRSAQDFISRYEDGDPAQGYSDDEAMTYLQGAMQRATPEQMERASQQALSRMNDDQRREFAEMLQQRQMGGVDRSGSGGGGLDDILGGLMGGGSGGSGGGGLGGLLGGLMGGGGGGGSILGDVDNDNTRRGGGGGGMGDMLGGLMGSTAGKAVVGGLAAYLMKELLGGKR